MAAAVVSGDLPEARLRSYTKLAREDQVQEAPGTKRSAAPAPSGRQRKPKRRR